MNVPGRTQGSRIAAVTDDDLPPRLTRLTFHGPFSEARAARLVERLTRTRPATVLDLGCGWGELMLRVLAEVPGASGTGIDLNGTDPARGRASAAARGLAGRVSFLEESAVGTVRGPADLVLCVGASHVLSEAKPPQHTIDALHALRRLVNPGGRVSSAKVSGNIRGRPVAGRPRSWAVPEIKVAGEGHKRDYVTMCPHDREGICAG
jgi:cyclopropane fatty-acyl-phospholipid synthase-like methyltransferase